MLLQSRAEQNGNPPTYLEVGAELGIGKSSARVLFAHLKRKGCLANAPGRYRNTLISAKGHQAIARLLAAKAPARPVTGPLFEEPQHA